MISSNLNYLLRQMYRFDVNTDQAFFYDWFYSGITRQYMSDIIEKFMMKNGLIKTRN